MSENTAWSIAPGAGAGTVEQRGGGRRRRGRARASPDPAPTSGRGATSSGPTPNPSAEPARSTPKPLGQQQRGMEARLGDVVAAARTARRSAAGRPAARSRTRVRAGRPGAPGCRGRRRCRWGTVEMPRRSFISRHPEQRRGSRPAPPPCARRRDHGRRPRWRSRARWCRSTPKRGRPGPQRSPPSPRPAAAGYRAAGRPPPPPTRPPLRPTEISGPAAQRDHVAQTRNRARRGACSPTGADAHAAHGPGDHRRSRSGARVGVVPAGCAHQQDGRRRAPLGDGVRRPDARPRPGRTRTPRTARRPRSEHRPPRSRSAPARADARGRASGDLDHPLDRPAGPLGHVAAHLDRWRMSRSASRSFRSVIIFM